MNSYDCIPFGSWDRRKLLEEIEKWINQYSKQLLYIKLELLKPCTLPPIPSRYAGRPYWFRDLLMEVREREAKNNAAIVVRTMKQKLEEVMIFRDYCAVQRQVDSLQSHALNDRMMLKREIIDRAKAALSAFEQECSAIQRQKLQANLGWAEKKAAFKAYVKTRQKAAPQVQKPAPITSNAAPWSHKSNSSGFRDLPALRSDEKSDKQAVNPKMLQKQNSTTVPERKLSAAEEFDKWCNASLSKWSSKINVPTFVNFLKTIEAPYEVEEYVICYIGTTKDARDFTANFLQRRSKLRHVEILAVDDLSSAAAAVKGTGKKNRRRK